ncbi:predicted protein [Botrytis cinerea T4]|uniref:Uncharacterized protein n=1 Tax=Botryotinia fuckeliana (strain T4) TaxID=999810 RepID=G2YTL2_BOTF4|nr:predicted protein [Botrytis cinerea T4]
MALVMSIPRQKLPLTVPWATPQRKGNFPRSLVQQFESSRFLGLREEGKAVDDVGFGAVTIIVTLIRLARTYYA